MPWDARFLSTYHYFVFLWIIVTISIAFDPEQRHFTAPGNISFSSSEPHPVDSTDNLVFNTVSSLLQKWPNTRYRNGHTVVLAQVPVGTLLYHGTSKNEIPRNPEWVATDPEHSFSFCRSISTHSGCWHLTLITTRPLKLLYFDGSSGAKMSDGVMDSQDLLIWDKIMPNKTLEEGERIGRLCEWGQEYGLDGFLRMAINFEIMLCNFSTGVEVSSFLNIVSADNARHKSLYPDNPDNPRIFPLRLSTAYRVLESGSWHNYFPGETRIRVDYSSLISFYDTSLFPDLHITRMGKDRRVHRLDEITPQETKFFKVRLVEVLTRGSCVHRSGVDWKTTLDAVVTRYAERLELLHYILDSIIQNSDYNATLQQAHRQVSSMIAPYTLWSSVSRIPDRPPTDYSWAVPVFDQCSNPHTGALEKSGLINAISDSEHLIMKAIKGVSREICNVLVGMWAEGMMIGLDGPDIELPSLQIQDIPLDTASVWKEKIQKLMTWLDWSYWIRCRPPCGYEEMCYLPMWPFFLTEEEKTDPQPKCIRRLESFAFKT